MRAVLTKLLSGYFHVLELSIENTKCVSVQSGPSLALLNFFLGCGTLTLALLGILIALEFTGIDPQRRRQDNIWGLTK